MTNYYYKAYKNNNFCASATTLIELAQKINISIVSASIIFHEIKPCYANQFKIIKVFY